MGQQSVADPEDSDNPRFCSNCSYQVKLKDAIYVEQFDVWHYICYRCGEEWVA